MLSVCAHAHVTGCWAGTVSTVAVFFLSFPMSLSSCWYSQVHRAKAMMDMGSLSYTETANLSLLSTNMWCSLRSLAGRQEVGTVDTWGSAAGPVQAVHSQWWRKLCELPREKILQGVTGLCFLRRFGNSYHQRKELDTWSSNSNDTYRRHLRPFRGNLCFRLQEKVRERDGRTDRETDTATRTTHTFLYGAILANPWLLSINNVHRKPVVCMSMVSGKIMWPVMWLTQGLGWQDGVSRTWMGRSLPLGLQWRGRG